MKSKDQLERDILAWAFNAQQKRAETVKHLPLMVPKMRVTLTVRKLEGGRVVGWTFLQDFDIPTISDVEARIEAKKAAREMGLDVGVVIEVIRL